MTEKIELNGSVALVTGGGQGLGFGFSEILVKSGAYVSMFIVTYTRLKCIICFVI